MLTEGLARATRPYCSSDAPSTTRTLWRGSFVSQQAVANLCDGLRRSTRLLLVINDDLHVQLSLSQVKFIYKAHLKITTVDQIAVQSK